MHLTQKCAHLLRSYPAHDLPRPTHPPRPSFWTQFHRVQNLRSCLRMGISSPSRENAGLLLSNRTDSVRSPDLSHLEKAPWVQMGEGSPPQGMAPVSGSTCAYFLWSYPAHDLPRPTHPPSFWTQFHRVQNL